MVSIIIFSSSFMANIPLKEQIPGGKGLIDNQALLQRAGVALGMRVVDFGCGRKGHFALQAGKIVGPQGIVYAVDILRSALESLKTNAQIFGLSNIKPVWADLEIIGSTKIPQGSVDFVMINNLLFQVENKKAVLEHAIKLLKDGGKLLITDWKKQDSPLGPSKEQRIGQEQVKKLVLQMGLKLKDEWDAGPYHWALVFEK